MSDYTFEELEFGFNATQWVLYQLQKSLRSHPDDGAQKAADEVYEITCKLLTIKDSYYQSRQD